MRPAVLFAVLLSVVCSPAVRLHAQSCIAPDRLGAISVTGTTCVYDSGNRRCEAGDTVTFTSTFLFGATPATCPTEVTWDFGDGTTLTSSDPSVTHTYAAGGRYLVEHETNVSGANRFSLLIAPGYIRFQPDSQSVEEGKSATIAVLRSGNLARPGTIDYHTSGGVPISGTLVFGAGEERKELVVQTLDNATWSEEDQFVRLVLSNPTGDWVFEHNQNSALIRVLDNDLPAIHRCAQTSIHVNERAGGVTFELTRSQNTAGTTTGYVRVQGDGKLDVYPPLTTTFAPGETTRFIELRWDDDAVYSDTQRARFFCGGQGPGVATTTFEGSIILTDDEPYPVMVAPAAIEVTETDLPQKITIPFSFTPPFDHPRGLQVDLDHITTNDRDVKSLTTYAYGQVELEIAGDDDPESDESVSVRLVGAVQGGITLVIADDDRPPFPYTFDRDNYEFDEANGGGSVVVQRAGSLASPVELLLRIRPTIPGVDVEEIAVLLEQGQSSKEVLLALDDAYFTGPRYCILELELGGFIGATSGFTLTDDEAMPLLSVGDGSVREGNLDQRPHLEVPVTLTGPLGAPLQLSLTPSHVSTDGNDFAAVPRTVTIAPGQLTGTAVFEVNGDITLEPDETFSVIVTSCCDSLATVARSSGTATIVNDDSAPTEAIYRLALGATTFKESDLWLTIPVRRFGQVSGTSRAILKLTAADARVFAPRTVSFAPNETAHDVRFFIDDFWHSGDTTVKIELFDGDRLLETASVSILENEGRPDVVTFGGAGYEYQKAAAITIRLFPPSAKPVIVRLRARSSPARDAATFGEDFLPFDTTVEIPPLTNTYVVSVPIRDDRVVEQTESFYIDLVDTNGSVMDYASVWIYDDDSAYVVSDLNVLRGSLITITVHFARPAPAKDALLFLAEPRFLEGPLTVPVPAGASSVSFQALAKTSGDITFAVESPAFLQSTRLSRRMIIYDEQAVTLNPAALELAPGASALVVIESWSGEYFTMKSGDWTIAATQTSAPVDGKHAFFVHANVPGQTEIVVTLPTPGGKTVRLPVVVKEPPVPVTPRRRAAGH